MYASRTPQLFWANTVDNRKWLPVHLAKSGHFCLERHHAQCCWPPFQQTGFPASLHLSFGPKYFLGLFGNMNPLVVSILQSCHGYSEVSKGFTFGQACSKGYRSRYWTFLLISGKTYIGVVTAPTMAVTTLTPKGFNSIRRVSEILLAAALELK